MKLELKLIIGFIVIILCSIIFATNYETLPELYRLDRVNSLNQSGNNMTADTFIQLKEVVECPAGYYMTKYNGTNSVCALGSADVDNSTIIRSYNTSWVNNTIDNPTILRNYSIIRNEINTTKISFRNSTNMGIIINQTGIFSMNDSGICFQNNGTIIIAGNITDAILAGEWCI